MKYALVMALTDEPTTLIQHNPRVLVVTGTLNQMQPYLNAFEALDVTAVDVAGVDGSVVAAGQHIKGVAVAVFDNVIVGDQIAKSNVAFEKYIG